MLLLPLVLPKFSNSLSKSNSKPDVSPVRLMGRKNCTDDTVFGSSMHKLCYITSNCNILIGEISKIGKIGNQTTFSQLQSLSSRSLHHTW